MKNRRNYYHLLRVQPDAPVEIIQAAFRALMLKLKRHPDLGGSTPEAADLNEAYEVLSDPKRRAEYDGELSLRCTTRAESPDMSPSTAASCPVCNQPLARKPQPGERCSTCQSPLQSEEQDDHRQAYERALARTRRDEKIFYYTSWPGKARQARMIDFSPHGMRFCSSEEIPPGTVLKIECATCEASGTVTNVRKEIVAGQEAYSIGVVFLAVSFVEPRGSFVSTTV